MNAELIAANIELRRALSQATQKLRKAVEDKDKLEQEHRRLGGELQRAAEERERAVQDCFRATLERRQAVEERDRLVLEHAHERTKSAQETTRAIEEKTEALEEKNQAHRERKHAIEERNQAIEERNKAIEERNQAIEERSEAVQGRIKAEERAFQRTLEEAGKWRKVVTGSKATATHSPEEAPPAGVITTLFHEDNRATARASNPHRSSDHGRKVPEHIENRNIGHEKKGRNQPHDIPKGNGDNRGSLRPHATAIASDAANKANKPNPNPKPLSRPQPNEASCEFIERETVTREKGRAKRAKSPENEAYFPSRGGDPWESDKENDNPNKRNRMNEPTTKNNHSEKKAMERGKDGKERKRVKQSLFDVPAAIIVEDW